MSSEPRYIKIRRQRRADGQNWTPDEEREWKERFPNAEPEPWMAGHPEFNIHIFDADLIPEVDHEGGYEKTPGDLAVENIGILEAYERWCGKMTPERGRKTEGIKLSCPIPGHADKHPSAWANTENDTWYCGACGVGGDQYEIAAYHYGYDVPGFKNDPKEFRALKMQMAEDLGYVQVVTPGGQVIEVEPENNEPDEPPIESSPSGLSGSADTEENVRKTGHSEPGEENVTKTGHEATSEEILTEQQVEPELAEGSKESNSDEPADSSLQSDDKPLLTIVPDLPDEDEPQSDARIDWEELVPEDTFLHEWMLATCVNDSPDEYLFWLGLQALGAAGGQFIHLEDQKPVYGNMFVCLYGGSGTKKSLAVAPLKTLIKTALPFDDDPTTYSEGVDLMGDIGSTEYFMESLGQKVTDVSTGKEVPHPKQTLADIPELSSFFGRTAKQSTNQLKEKFMDAFDAYSDEITYKSYSKKIIVKRPFFQAVSTTQPAAIRVFLDRGDIVSGFLNRWVFASGTPRRTPLSHGGIEPDIEQPTDTLRQLRSWVKKGRKLQLNYGTPAFQIWDDFFHSQLYPHRESTGDDIYKRIDLYLKKLIVLFCINEKQSVVTSEIVERVTKLFPYLVKTYSMFSQALKADDYSDCMQEIETILASGGTNIFTLSKQLYSRHSLEIVLKCIQQMEATGMIEVDAKSVKSKDRSKIVYRLVK